MRKTKILIVEDDGIVAKDEQYILETLGYDVLTPVATGEAALEKCAEGQPDLVLMDIKLKGEIDGIETVEQIQNRFDVPVIYLSAYADRETLERVKITGPFGYLLKPFAESELHTTIEMALYKHQMERKLKEKAARLTILNDISAAAVSSLDLDTILHQILELTCQALDAAEGSILLRDPTTDELFFAFDLSDGASNLQGRRLAPGQGIASWVAQHGEPSYVKDVSQDPRWHPGVDAVTGFETYSLLCAPLKHRDRIIGVIEIVNKRQGEFSEEDLSLLVAVSGITATALANARLYRDLQEQMRMLQRTQARLVQGQKLAALGRLTASIAHEINNPLQSILGNLTLLKEDPDHSQLSAKLSSYLDVAGEEIERIASIVRRMRDFYHLARSAHETDSDYVGGDLNFWIFDELQTVDLHVSLDNVLQLTHKQLQQHNITVECHWANELPIIQGSPDYLKQVFLNLTLNAIDAMATQGGTLRVSTALDQLTSAAEQTFPAVRIEFSDTGEGMLPEVQSRLFEPLFTTKEQGVGFGLFNSFEIIEAHHGQITVESQIGLGTTFTILLPIERT